MTEYRDRHGKKRYRFRKKGLPVYHFRHAPGTEEFRQEYEAAKSADKPEILRAKPFTYDALIASFYRSQKWQAMQPSSQQTYRGIIERFRAKNGTKDARKVNAAAIDAKLGTMAATPAAANNLRKTLSRLHRHAIKLGWRIDNPVDATDAYPAGKGYHTWTEKELAAFDRQWPFGTRQRLAKELLLWGALRRSDMILVGRQHRRGDKLHLHHSKNNSATIIPISRTLAQALDSVDSGTLTYLVTERGQPYSSGASFYNWFQRACAAAGIPHCTPHGLRKAASRRLAESGATSLQGRAITGHKTDKFFEYYAREADQEAMAAPAMANVESKFANGDD
ncbi:tyrosine-type recombinase/integrase [Allopontixanthobacter sp.]|uniref:tyrosine-type recombinase/integrase n=1 Tax=Allopontixanthobacter sp. TaxID=2906452 RepID=UPI002ABBF504|nr:tyrosine-type recombinase/integrase [Allopontixanthobacter sp.]MDZ4307364.1 tyrosine-type recombinase/integrase [Allopontixanthobacter sp.]